jgi:hypothetical protein
MKVTLHSYIHTLSSFLCLINNGPYYLQVSTGCTASAETYSTDAAGFRFPGSVSQPAYLLAVIYHFYYIALF